MYVQFDTQEDHLRTLTSFRGLMGILDCLMGRLLSPMFFTEIRGLTFEGFCFTAVKDRQTVSISICNN